MGAFNMVIAMVSPEVFAQLNHLGCSDHDAFMHWLQDTGVTNTHIAENVCQLQGSWEVVSNAKEILDKLLTLHKAENMEELCNWLRDTSCDTESREGPKSSPALVNAATQTECVSGGAVTEEIVQAIHVGFRTATQSVQQHAQPASLSSPSFAPQINIYTGEKSPRRGRGRPRKRSSPKAKLVDVPSFTGLVPVKIEPCSDPENALEEDEEDQNSDHETGDEDYQPSQPAKKRRTVPPPKVVLQTKAKTEAVEGEESYMTRVESHAPAESRAERSARIEGFMTTVPEGTKAFEGGLRFGCTVCEFKARMKSRVATHVRRMHIPPADYSCRVCGKKYNVKRDLKRHIRNHDVSLVCDVCGKRYRDRRTLEMHVKRHEEGYDPKPFGCEECSQSFCNQYVLKRHVDSMHRGIKEEHICQDCGKIFTQKHSLAEHAALHLEQRPHVCDICGASFTYKSSLRSHRRTQHTEPDTRKFVCTVCSKGFKTRGTLEKHKVIHDADKRIPCPMCGKLFTQPSAVSRHMVTHTGEKNHKCTICGQGFNDPSILRRHYSGVHKMDMPKKKAGRPLPPGAQGIVIPPRADTPQGETSRDETKLSPVDVAQKSDAPQTAACTSGDERVIYERKHELSSEDMNRECDRPVASRPIFAPTERDGERSFLRQFHQEQMQSGPEGPTYQPPPAPGFGPRNFCS